MRVLSSETTTELLVKAYTTLQFDGFEYVAGQRTARITTAEVYWRHDGESWGITFVQLSGPVVRKSDGAESTAQVSQTTHLPGVRLSGPVTPPHVVDAALAAAPQWQPTLTVPSPYRMARTIL